VRLDSEELPQRLARGVDALYTIVGEEPLLALEAGDRLRATARAAGFAERRLLVVESGFDWGSLAAEGASLSLFAERRMIELRIPNGKPGTAGAQALIKYCARLPDDTVTVVHLPALDWKAAQAEWVLALDHAGVLVEAKTVHRSRLPAWLAGRLARQKQTADDATLAFIADRVEGNLLAAWQEVQKLALLLPQGLLEHEEVRKAVLDVARFDISALSEALLGGDTTYYVRILDGLQSEGAGLPLVLWTLANDLRAAYMARAAMDRGAQAFQALKDARIFGPRRNLMEQALRRWRLPQLEAALLHAGEIDRTIKGLGRGDAWDELRRLGLRLTGPSTPPRPRMAARARV
jgi:DNA polymerase-3 subunit delta